LEPPSEPIVTVTRTGAEKCHAVTMNDSDISRSHYRWTCCLFHSSNFNI